MDDDFVAGDFVTLVIGGPQMVVNSLEDDFGETAGNCSYVQCIWVDSENDIQTHAFHKSVLKPYELL